MEPSSTASTDPKTDDPPVQKGLKKDEIEDGEKSSGVGAGKGDGSSEVDEMKAKKIEAIKARIEALNTELATAKERLSTGTAELKHPPVTTVKQHIHLLHEYNEIRDIGQGLIGMIADNRGVRILDVYEEFGVSLGD